MPKVQLLFDETFAYAGSTLNGSIKVSLKQPHELKDVYLTLFGSQEVRLLETRQVQKTRTVPVKRYDAKTQKTTTTFHTINTTEAFNVPHEHTCTLLNEQVLLKSGKEILPGGEHFLPFSVALREDLPASHNKYQINLRRSGYNYYTATASLFLNNTRFTAKCEFVLHEALKPMKPLSLEGFYDLGIVCLCWTSSRITIKAASIKNTFTANEAISLDLSADCRQLKTDLGGMSIALYERVEYTSGTFSTATSKCLCKANVPKLKKGSNFRSTFLLQVPELFNPATHSAGISVHHFISISLDETSDPIVAPLQLYLQNTTITDRSNTDSPISVTADSDFKLQK